MSTTRIAGDVSAADLTAAQRATLVEVTGALFCDSLTSADGAFPALVSVGGTLRCPALTDAQRGFPALERVGGRDCPRVGDNHVTTLA